MKSSLKLTLLIVLVLLSAGCVRPEKQEFPMHGQLEIVETGEVLEISSEGHSVAVSGWRHDARKVVFQVTARAYVSVVPEEWGPREGELAQPPEITLAIYFRSGVDFPNDQNRSGLEDLEATDGFIPLVELAYWSHGLIGAAKDPAGCPVSGLSDPDGAHIEIVGDPPEFETITIRVDNTCQRGELVITR